MNEQQAEVVAQELIQDGNQMMRESLSFAKFLSVLLVGVQYTGQINELLNTIWDLFQRKRETDFIKAGDAMQIEEKMKRELPKQCERHLYRDATGQLRSIVFCRSVNGQQRVYEDQ